uniref:Uncharacterized protein n=1 Tax=Amazona collaria TaxID=241587 RepID=A0A8B9EWX4_9PSIT
LDKDKNVYLCNRKSDFRIEYSILEGLEQSLTVSRKTESKWGITWGFLFAFFLMLLLFFVSLEHVFIRPTGMCTVSMKILLSSLHTPLPHPSPPPTPPSPNPPPLFSCSQLRGGMKSSSKKSPGNLKEKKKSEKMPAMEAWKEQKAIALSMEQASQLKPEEKKEKKQQKEHQCQCHMKLVLEKYTLLKKEKEELEKLEKKREEAGKEERKRTAAEEIKFQQRFVTHSVINEKDQFVCLFHSEVEAHVNKDWRLYRLTKGWEEGTKEVTPPASEPIVHTYSSAVPAWRQGL